MKIYPLVLLLGIFASETLAAPVAGGIEPLAAGVQPIASEARAGGIQSGGVGRVESATAGVTEPVGSHVGVSTVEHKFVIPWLGRTDSDGYL
jgi:hypothetical protein